jgi:hypothetical protein
MKITKSKQVLDHLLKKKSITTWEAIMLYQNHKLAQNILNLREDGYFITTNMIKDKDSLGEEREYAKYILVSIPKHKK